VNKIDSYVENALKISIDYGFNSLEVVEGVELCSLVGKIELN